MTPAAANDLAPRVPAVALFPRSALHAAALAIADASLSPAAPWCVAFSGGADSLALLHTLLALYPSQRARLHALHFNHRLRGLASDADELFCRETCAALGVPFHSASWHEVPAAASESAARSARHTFFAETMSALGARVLFTGHQLDDIAETQLMRLARGSSSSGLAAPRPVQLHRDGRTFLRPLLTLRKTEILTALRAAGLGWREDASNATGDYFRNRVRHEVLPALHAASPHDPLSGAALTRELLDEDAAALDAWLDELLPASSLTTYSLQLTPLLDRPRALWRRALRRWPPAAELARAGFEQLLAAAQLGHGQLTTEHGLIQIANHVLTLTPPSSPPELTPYAFTLTPSAPLALPDAATLTLTHVTLTPAARARILSGRINSSTTAFLAHPHPDLTVRNWQLGDRYRPLGAPGSAKLSDLFINHKIPSALRSALPIVCARDGRILWIPGFPPADEEKLTDDSITVVQLTYHSGTSTVSL